MNEPVWVLGVGEVVPGPASSDYDELIAAEQCAKRDGVLASPLGVVEHQGVAEGAREVGDLLPLVVSCIDCKL